MRRHDAFILFVCLFGIFALTLLGVAWGLRG
jgi:hypothetical protein